MFSSDFAAKMRTLYLSDVYAVSQGSHSHPTAPTPLTPHSPGARSHPLTPSSSSASSSSASTRSHNQAINPKKLRRSSSTSLGSSSSSTNCYFTLHALKSHPGTIGRLIKVSFRCPTPETAETWVEQITHQMQSKWTVESNNSNNNNNLNITNCVQFAETDRQPAVRQTGVQ